ncbi:MAG: D-2-hydroxyacid dehydrogenase [Fastidiosipilaceae bacterium]|jgi:glycerate dehydrogenase|nr:D-2-hydroxyacid dehydrogenase [Clostridiaceae bacterium]
MNKIVILDGYTINPGDLSWSGLEAFGELTVYDRTDANDAIDRIGDANLILTSKVPITPGLLDACPNLKYVGVLATGYNNVDVDAARDRGIVVTNIPAYSTASVAQFVFSLLLEVCHHVGHHNAAVKSGRWEQSPDFCFWDYPLIELAEKKLGVIGYGQIGRAVAQIGCALGMDVQFYARRVIEGGDIAKQVSLDELLETSDVITLHVPLTPETKFLINKTNLAKMKDSAIVINTARGPVVNEVDMAAALENGDIAYYAADVVDVEPIRSDNPLLTAPNCILTPHIAWAGKESRARLIDIAVSNVESFLQGREKNAVN